MANDFNFSITASDNASVPINAAADAAQALTENAEHARDSLTQVIRALLEVEIAGKKATGGESQRDADAMTGYFNRLSRLGKDTAQHFGDIVPPLRNVGALTQGLTGTLGRFGAVGGALAVGGMAVGAVTSRLKEASDTAYDLDVNARNAGMSVSQFSRYVGVFRQLGYDAQQANAETGALFTVLNDAANGRNYGAVGVLNQFGIQVERNRDGTANLEKTTQNLIDAFGRLGSAGQKVVADALGLSDAQLALIRSTRDLNAALEESDRLGLTMADDLNEKLVRANTNLNRLSAAWSGFTGSLNGAVLGSDTVTDAVDWATQKLLRIPDASGVISAEVDAQKEKGLDGIAGDIVDDFMKAPSRLRSMSLSDVWDAARDAVTGSTGPGSLKNALDWLTSDERIYYRDRRLKNQAETLRGDLMSITTPPALPPAEERNTEAAGDNGRVPRGIRNNNPGNLRDARNATGHDGEFVTFDSPEDGISALARQLRLYNARGNNTLSGIISKFAPPVENNTASYISDASRRTGFYPRQPLDIEDPQVTEKIVRAIIRHENGVNPYPPEMISRAVSNAWQDPKWGSRILPPLRSPVVAPEGGIVSHNGTSVSGITEEVREGIQQGVRQAFTENQIGLNIRLTDMATGRSASQRVQGGKVSTAMNF